LARFKNVLLIGAVIAALGMFAAACDDEADSESNAQQSDITAINERIQRNEQMNALLSLGTLGLHAMDEDLNETGVIDPSYARNTTTALRILEVTDWGDHAEQAETTRQAGIDVLAALDVEDADAAAAAATELHDGWHDLEAGVWPDILGDLPPEEGGVESHDEEGEEGDHGTEEAGDGAEGGDHSEGDESMDSEMP
jgi:hypothetical protein